MKLKTLLELGNKNYDLLSEESKKVNQLLNVFDTLGVLPDIDLDENKMTEAPSNKISNVEELHNKKCGKFSIQVLTSMKGEEDTTISVIVYAYFEGLKREMEVYNVDINEKNTFETVVKDLKTFGFNFEVEDKIHTITYKDKEIGKLVGIIRYNSKERLETKLGKFKYINLADMFRTFNKDIDKFNKTLSDLFDNSLEIIYS